MAVDMFLILDGIKGEAQDAKHKDAIDVLAFSWGMAQAGKGHTGGGSGAGKVVVDNLSITKFIDKATPALMLRCCTGEHIAKGKLIVRKAGKDPVEYIVNDFEQILVTEVSTGGAGSEDRLTENITLNIRKFDFKYTIQNKDGSKGAEIPAKFNIAENKAE